MSRAEHSNLQHRIRLMPHQTFFKQIKFHLFVNNLGVDWSTDFHRDVIWQFRKASVSKSYEIPAARNTRKCWTALNRGLCVGNIDDVKRFFERWHEYHTIHAFRAHQLKAQLISRSLIYWVRGNTKCKTALALQQNCCIKLFNHQYFACMLLFNRLCARFALRESMPFGYTIITLANHRSMAQDSHIDSWQTLMVPCIRNIKQCLGEFGAVKLSK